MTTSVCELHAQPESQLCRDCGAQAWFLREGWRVAHEDFYVHDQLWDEVCPDDEVREWEDDGVRFREGNFVLCIGCFEERLGRQLTQGRLHRAAEPAFWNPTVVSVSPEVEDSGGSVQLRGSGAGERI